MRVPHWAIPVLGDDGEGEAKGDGQDEGRGNSLEQWIRDESRWQRVKFGVFLNSLLYLLVLPPEREGLTRSDFIGVQELSLDDYPFLFGSQFGRVVSIWFGVLYFFVLSKGKVQVDS